MASLTQASSQTVGSILFVIGCVASLALGMTWSVIVAVYRSRLAWLVIGIGSTLIALSRLGA